MHKICDQHIQILEKSQLVAIPTETVYGLAARIDRPDGIRRIFELKQRPSFDPLIVHFSQYHQVQSLIKEESFFKPYIKDVMDRFWPGPLTLVLPKSDQVSDAITSGLPTVALRMPRHPLTLELIDKVNVPLAAPSANPFGRVSPTSALHVHQYFPELTVIDGGECEVGIESTIIELKKNWKNELCFQILRPGMLLEKDIEGLFKKQESDLDLSMAPGRLKDHYQPRKPVFLKIFETPEPFIDPLDEEVEIVGGNSEVFAHNFYKNLLHFDRDKCKTSKTFYISSEKTQDPQWIPIFDRLLKVAKTDPVCLKKTESAEWMNQ